MAAAFRVKSRSTKNIIFDIVEIEGFAVCFVVLREHMWNPQERTNTEMETRTFIVRKMRLYGDLASISTRE